jgi:hypothetical protein
MQHYPSAKQSLTILYTTCDNTQQYLSILQYLIKLDCIVMYCTQYCKITILTAMLRLDIIMYCCKLLCIAQYCHVLLWFVQYLSIQMKIFLCIVIYCKILLFLYIQYCVMLLCIVMFCTICLQCIVKYCNLLCSIGLNFSNNSEWSYRSSTT